MQKEHTILGCTYPQKTTALTLSQRPDFFLYHTPVVKSMAIPVDGVLAISLTRQS